MRKIYTIGFALLGLAILVGVFLAVVISGNKAAAAADPGVTACKEMAAPGAPADLDEAWRTKRLKAFGNSKYEDLLTAGTNFTEVAFKFNKELKSLNLEEVQEQNANLEKTHEALRTACGNHGVKLSKLGS